MTRTPHTGAASGSAAAALDLLERSRASLAEACRSRSAGARHQQAQLAALRAAAAVVAARRRPGGESGPHSVWDLVPGAAPELAEWAGFFAVAAAPGDRPPGTRGTRGTTAREADDLLRQAETFVDLVARSLGLPTAPAHDTVLVPVVLTPLARA